MKWIITLKSGEKVETIAFTYTRNNQLIIWEVPNSEYYSGRVILGSDIESVKFSPQ